MKAYSIDLKSDLGNIYLLTHVGTQLAQEYGLDMAEVLTDFINARGSLDEVIDVFEYHFGNYVDIINKPKFNEDNNDYLSEWQKEILEHEGIVTNKDESTKTDAPYVRMKLFLN